MLFQQAVTDIGHAGINIPRSVKKLILEAEGIEREDAKSAGALGFMAKAMVQATLPHKNPQKHEFVRCNGKFTLAMTAPSMIGLPYGSFPRLLLAWLTTEAVKTKCQTIVLGHSLSEFMRSLGYSPTGGTHGTITTLRKQTRRLFATSITCFEFTEGEDIGKNYPIVEEYRLWWTPQRPEDAGLWQSTVTLSKGFYEEAIKTPVPVDMRAMQALSRSPMALDIYTWLTYRLSYLRAPSPPIPWAYLRGQFGAELGQTWHFKAKFCDALRKVLTVYPDAKVEPQKNGLILKPSKTHIPKK
jgi:hypothetical protein